MNRIFYKSVSTLLACALAVAGLAFGPATPARAAGNIYFVGGCILPICGGGSWNTGFLTLQEALATAASGDQIWVRMGTYYPDEGPGQVNNSRDSTFTLKNGVEIYGGFAGTETQLSQRNLSANTTILSGDIDKNDVVSANGFVLIGNNAYHVVTGSGTNNTAILDGFLIRQGQANGVSGFTPVGGGIMNENGHPTLQNLTLYSNYAELAGAGVYNRESSPALVNVTFNGNHSNGIGGGMNNYISSNPLLANVAFNENTAGQDGGGMYNYDSDPQLTSVTFNNNTAAFKGGGMVNFGNSLPVLVHTTFTGNSASWGAGIFNEASSPSLTDVTFQSNDASIQGGGMSNEASSPSLTNVDFIDNTAETGAGMYNLGSLSAPVLTNVTFDGNIASVDGGGLYNTFESIPTLTNSTFSDNQALQGGGMYNNNSDPVINQAVFQSNSSTFNGAGIYNLNSQPALTNITFFDNGAGGNGGGMYNSSSSPSLVNATFSANATDHDGGGMFNFQSNPTLTNVTFSGNHAVDGSGLYNNTNSLPTLINTLIANSIVGGDCVNNNGASLNPASVNNLIEDSADECSLVNGVNDNIVGSDPSLGLLQNNGGFTQTHALLAGSPAIDAGTSSGCPSTDQRGIHRPLNGDSSANIQCDIGVFEAFPATPIFVDVPADHWAVAFIERLYAFGITGGCAASPLSYCPTNPVTRAQMAIFLEKGIHSPFFVPANVPPTFTDTIGHFAEDWIEALKSDGVTSGCGAGIYCPESPVTRAQMAIFLLKAKYGASFSPPPASGTFADVPTSHFAAAFIEQLAAEGITSGCAAGLYCPENSVTRDQMAVFLVKAFNLP